VKDPLVKLIVVGCISFAALSRSSTWFLAGAALYYVLWTASERMTPALLLARIRGTALFLALILIVSGFSGSGNVVASVAGHYLTKEGMESGLAQVSRLLIVLWGATLLVWSTPVEYFIDVAERWTRRRGHPLIAAGTIALNYLPLLIARARRINTARAARGLREARWISGTAIARVAGASVPLFAAALRDADALAEAMESRCFDAISPRTPFRSSAIPPWEMASACCVVCLTLATALGLI